MKKTILIVVFAIPVIIALILNIFGENTFSVQVYYETGVNSAECGVSTTEQYRIKDLAGTSLEGKTSIIFFKSELNNNFSSIRSPAETGEAGRGYHLLQKSHRPSPENRAGPRQPRRRLEGKRAIGRGPRLL